MSSINDLEINIVESEETLSHQASGFPRSNFKWEPPLGVLVSKTYTHILNDPVMGKLNEEYEALSNEEKRVYDLALDKKIRQNFRKKSLQAMKSDVELAVLLKKDIKCFEFQGYLEQITKQLELEGLWREESAEVLESDAFLISDTKDEDLDDNFDPKTLDVIYKPKNLSASKKNPLNELKEQGLEWQDRFSVSQADLPELTTPSLHNLIRRSPWGLNEAIARHMIEGSFFSKKPELEDLYPCAYFISKSIFTRTMFIQAKYEAFASTPLQKKFRTYSYHRYLKDQKRLEKLTSEILKNYFIQNPFVRENVKKFIVSNNIENKDEKTLLKTIWQRFFEVTKKLTKKQEEALHLIYMEDPPLTYDEAAIREGISKDSFQDRIRGAVKKIKAALPELEGLIEPKTYYKNKEKNLLYNGLFYKDAAVIIHPLFRVDPLTHIKILIPLRTEKPSQSKNAPTRTAVRAWAINATPIPDIGFTDFFLGLIPEAYLHRKTGRSRFRG